MNFNKSVNFGLPLADFLGGSRIIIKVEPKLAIYMWGRKSVT